MKGMEHNNELEDNAASLIDAHNKDLIAKDHMKLEDALMIAAHKNADIENELVKLDKKREIIDSTLKNLDKEASDLKARPVGTKDVMTADEISTEDLDTKMESNDARYRKLEVELEKLMVKYKELESERARHIDYIKKLFPQFESYFNQTVEKLRQQMPRKHDQN